MKWKCDSSYTFDKTSRRTSCETCLRRGAECLLTKPLSWDDRRLKAKQLQWKSLGQPRTRESSDESYMTNTTSGDCPSTVNPAELSLDHTYNRRNVAPVAYMGQ